MASAADAFSETNSLLDRGPVGIAIVRASATISYGTSTRLYRDVEYIAGRKTARDRERGERMCICCSEEKDRGKKKPAERHRVSVCAIYIIRPMNFSNLSSTRASLLCPLPPTDRYIYICKDF